MEENGVNTHQRGSDAPGVRILFKIRDIGGTALWRGYLGGHPPYGHGPGGCLDPGGETADGKAPAEGNGRDVEIHLAGGGKGGRRIS